MESVVREEIERQIFGQSTGRRFTQDSPILTDVWIAFGENLGRSQDLIILPHREDSAGRIAEDINQALKARREIAFSDINQERDPARIAHLPGVIAARLYFDELLCLVLPKTRWWAERVQRYIASVPETGDYSVYRHFPNPESPADREELRELLIKDIARVEERPTKHAHEGREKFWPSPDLIWTVRLIGYITSMRNNGTRYTPSSSEMVDAFLKLFNTFPALPIALSPHRYCPDGVLYANY